MAILGTGNVGRAIAKGLAGKHDVRFGSRNPAKAKVPVGTDATSPKEAAAWADVVVLAVPYLNVKETVRTVGPETLKGKILVDATNVISPSRELAVGFTTSGAEELAKIAPGAKVVKAFNSVFAPNMSTGRVGGEALSLLVAGDDAGAKETVLRLGRDIGFEPVDAGPLTSARYLEPLGMQMIRMGLALNMGTGIGLKLVQERPKGPSSP